MNALHDATSTPSFPFVGIGASAGGLEAIGEFLKSLPTDTGMAFIFVQHLAPDHPSALTEILSRKTAMPVTEVTEEHQVEPNHVYVISPNTTLRVIRGRLDIKARDDTSGHPTPVDDLLHSLAEDQGSHAIGVILSGAGTDGAIGLQAIKSEGGITFAQDEMSAQYGSMPQSAVNLGCVDFVAAPRGIAEELVRICHHPLWSDKSAPDADRLGATEANFKKIFDLLQNACNVDFTHYKRGTIKRRLSRRIALLNLKNTPDYIDFLNANPDEVKTLGQELLINVTSFFRDPEMFEGLAKYLFSRIVDGQPKTSLRFWVPGCSTGQEVYSLAICCLEYQAEKGIKTPIQIFGTDVSEDALRRARTGLYVESMMRYVSPERLEKFFVKSGPHYQISRSVRDLCVFASHDVTRDPPFSKLDLISCRNLLIYLDPLLQRRVIPIFHYALKNTGILILGPAESIGGFTDLFALVDNNKIKAYSKKMVPGRSPLKYLEGYTGRSRSLASVTPASPDNLLKKKPMLIEPQKREADRITQGRYVPAAVLCDKDLNILEFRGDTSLYLSQPSGQPNVNLQKLAKPGLLVEISGAIRKVAKDGTAVRKSGLQVDTAAGKRTITLEVIAVQPAAMEDPQFLVFFDDAGHPVPSMAEALGFWSTLAKAVRQSLTGRGKVQLNRDAEVSRLKRDLDDASEHIRSMLEQHAAAKEEGQVSQEELLSSNEEFQSTNEELETAKEELQSANEELQTTNEEIRQRHNELHETNDKLQHALDYAETIIKTVSQPFLVLDDSFHVLQANAAFYKTFKTTPKETEGLVLYDLGNKQWDIPELRQYLQSLVSKDTSFGGYEITHVFPKVGKKTMRLNGAHLVSKEREQILLAMEDVSGYRDALTTLKDNDQHKNEFLAMLAHELRNPLAPIRNALEIWRRGDAGAKKEKESQNIMARQLRKVVRLVDDLLDISRITSGAIILKKDQVDLVRLVKHSAEGVHHYFEGRQQELSISLPEEKIFVKGDAVRLDQVICNLLINASKYTEPGGKIAITLEREQEQEHALIHVTDNGIGINPQLLPYIFDLFVQAERSLDRKQGGLGIGLTLVRRLVELQDGTVQAKSRGLEKGSEFIVSLPIIPEAELATPAATVETKDTPFIARRVLIIDDNADAVQTTQMLLELQGHNVQCTLDGPSGLKVARTFKPEVVLLDIGLPEMDGYDVAQRLREMPETRSVLLIALTGYGQTEDFSKTKEAGFDHHIVKPADVEQLQQILSGMPGA